MTPNPNLQRLHQAGVSIWLDTLSRQLLDGGEFAALIDDYSVTGATSNPTIFAKAITASDLYDEQVRGLVSDGRRDTKELFFSLALDDVGEAARLLRPEYDRTDGGDGFISFECTPDLADETEATIAQATDLWERLAQPNVMIKVPGTEAGLPAIEELTRRGLNINITLLFSVERYREVMEAHQSALEERRRTGQSLAVPSVASFFVSRVDTNVDPKLDALVKKGNERARSLRSRLAIANARIAYEVFEETIAAPRWKALEGAGARVQRPLWASTSTKDPKLPDLYYVDALIAPRSVDTMPPETLDAFRDHGEARVRVRDDRDEAHAALRTLRELGISFEEVTDELEKEGVKKFGDSFDSLMKTIGEKQRAMRVA
jgi:transaldolase